MAAAYAQLDDLKPIFLQGLNERITPESIPIGDLSQLIGLRQNKLGELVRYPGEAKINLGIFSSIRGLFFLGDYIIIQTATSLIRARLDEIFPEIPQTSPELLPDFYTPGGPTPPAINPELMSYSLAEYRLTTGTDPGATVTNVWNKVPINTVVNDANVRLAVSGANVLTLTAGSYPRGVRVSGDITVLSPSSIAANANSSQRAAIRLKNNTTLAVILDGTNGRFSTANAASEGRQEIVLTIKGRFTLSAATDFVLEAFTTESSLWGKALNVGGKPEVYAQVEFLVEE